MAKSDIISTITARIAAATSATPADELATLKVLGNKLGLNVDNIKIQAGTASNTASGKDLYDVVLLNQALDDYGSKSYVGEVRAMSPLLPNSVTYEDGSKWVKQGFYETDSTKVNRALFPYAAIGSAPANTGLVSFTPAGNTITGETVRLKSGKHISFGYGGMSGAITCFNDPAVAGTLLNAAIAACDYSYDEVNDILYILVSGSTLYKITSDGTVITSFTTANYGIPDTSAGSVLARNGVVYVGGAGKIRKSTDGGTSWSDNIFTGITAGYYVHRMAYVENENKLVVFSKSTSSLPLRTSTDSLDLHYSINGAAFVASTGVVIEGFPHAILNFKNNLLFLTEYTNGTTSKQRLHCMYAGSNTFTPIFDTTLAGSNGFRAKMILSADKEFFIGAFQTLPTELKLTAYTIENNSINAVISYTSTTYIPIDSGTGMGRHSITLYNDSLYLRTQAIGTYRKLPLYGITNTNTPHSFLRVL